MPKSKIYKTRIEIPPPSTEIIVKWFVVSFPPTPQTTEKWETAKLKVKAYVLETIPMVKREGHVKKLTSTLFWISPRQDGDNFGLPAYNLQQDRCLQYEPYYLTYAHSPCILMLLVWRGQRWNFDFQSGGWEFTDALRRGMWNEKNMSCW